MKKEKDKNPNLRWLKARESCVINSAMMRNEEQLETHAYLALPDGLNFVGDE